MSESDAAGLSNPFSCGGGGVNFENAVQTIFAVLMLTGGVIPCIRPWPIKQIKLQGKHAGFNTDDFIAFVEQPNGAGKAKLLAQIKHSVGITEGDATFGEVIKAAWDDFNNPTLFDPDTDAFALISGPLSGLDIDHARPLLEWARAEVSAEEFFRKVELANFSHPQKRAKLKAFREQLKKANAGNDVDDQKFWKFLKCFHILGYDLDLASGVTLSLMHSHISQFTTGNVSEIWALVAREVFVLNQSAGTIVREKLSAEIRELFEARTVAQPIPAEFLQPRTPAPAAVPLSENEAEALLFASLLGGWNDKNEADQAAIDKLIKGDD